MEKRTGTVAGFLAILALFIHTATQSGSEHAIGASNPAGKTEPSASTKATDNPANNAKVPRGPWLATQQYFDHKPLDGSPNCATYLRGSFPADERAASCISDELSTLFGFESGFDSKRNVRGLIATIPDPLHTRMSMAADRTLDSIQQAAYRAGWEFATQWLPWNITDSSPANASSAEQSSVYELSRETMPGLIVFRHHFTVDSSPEEILLVFVVGETPTAGINGFQFEFARECLLTFQGQPRSVSILGPNFSGSFPSLTRLIEKDPDLQRHYEIRSGSVSNLEYADTMLAKIEDDRRNAEFHGYSAPSSELDDFFRHLVHDVWNYRDDQAAQLIEDESGFAYRAAQSGRTMLPNDEAARGFAVYRYSRDIAQLRNSYRDIAFANGNTAESTAQAALDFSLKDSQSGEDNFPIFSQSHTPVSQNAVLQQIINDLSRRNIRVVRLDATNVFDTLFLARVLRKYCPNIRVVVSNPDLLFTQQSADGSLIGLMAMSNTPAFPVLRERADGNFSSPTTLPDSDSFGEYSACLRLLASMDNQRGQVKNIASATGLDDTSAAGWLTALGRDGWWTVDYLVHKNPDLARAHRSWFDSSVSEDEQPPLFAQAPNWWRVLCTLIALINIVIFARCYFLLRHPEILVWSCLCPGEFRWRRRGESAVANESARTAESPRKVRDAACLCLLACFGAMLLAAGIELIPVLMLSFVHLPLGTVGWPDTLLEGLLVVGFVLPLAGSLYLLTWFIARPFDHDSSLGQLPNGDEETTICTETNRYRITLVGIAAAIFSLPVMTLGAWAACCGGGLRGLLLCIRAESLSIGVSPVWPLLLCAIALFLVAFFNLRRFTWAGSQRPILSTAVVDDALGGQIKRLTCLLNRQLLSPADASPRFVLWVSLAVVFISTISVALLTPKQDLRSLEPKAFEWALLGLLLPLIGMTGFAFLQFATCWSTVRGFLVALDSLVVGRFFTRIPDFAGSGPVWFRQVSLLSLATSANSAIALHNLHLAAKSSPEYLEKYWQALRTFIDVKENVPALPAADSDASSKPPKDRAQFARDYMQFRFVSAIISEELTKQVIEPYWSENMLPFLDAEDKEKAADDEKVHSESAYRFAMKFVVLQYSAFIAYVLRQLQNLLLCSVSGFVLVVLGLNSYVFQAPQTITRFLILGLVGAGVIVIRALAQMERDPILSRLSGTTEGELGKDFYVRVLGYGALPILTVVSSQFPAVSQFLLSWAGPSLEALK